MSTDPAMQPFVPITLTKIYDEVTGMRLEIRELANSVKVAVDQGRDHETRIRILEKSTSGLDDMQKKDDDVERRLRAVERKTWVAAGVVAVISAGAGVGATLLSTMH